MTAASSYRRLATWGTPAAVIVVSALGIANYRATEAVMVARSAERQLALTRTVAVGVETALSGHAATLVHLSALPSVQRVSLRALPDRLAQFFASPELPGFDDLVRVMADGRTWRFRTDGTLLTPDPQSWPETHLLEWAADPANRGRWRPWVGRTAASTRLLVTLPVYDTAFGDDGWTPTGGFIGLLGLVLDPEALATPYARSALAVLPSAGLELRDGDTLLYVGGQTLEPKQPFSSAHALGDGSGVNEDLRTDGSIIESRTSLDVPERQLMVRLMVPRAWIVADVRRLFVRDALLFLALIFATLAAGWALLRAARSEGRYRELLEQAADGVFVLDEAGRVVDVNAAGASLAGVPPGALAGRSFDDLVDAGSRQAWTAATMTLAGRGRAAMSLTLRSATGDAVDTDASVSQKAAGQHLVILRDARERRRLEHQLQQAQKMEAVGRLAGGIAHDFNNLLTAIAGYTDLLLVTFSDRDERREDALQVKRATERAAALTRQLLAVGRKQVLQPRVLDLNALVRRMEALLTRLCGEHIQFELALDPRLAAVEADAGQLEQVLVNLVVNARDAMPTGGSVRVETANVDEALPPASFETGPVPIPGVRLSVIDTGAGMDADTLSHVFDPFFTTKQVGQGSGLGLPTAQGIVQQSRGELRVTSARGLGTRMDVVLPRVSQPPASPEPESEAPHERAPMAARVLLVEDETVVRRFARRTLEGLGYAVHEAPTPTDALRWLETAAAPPDVLLTDVVMPHINGVELADAARRRWPTLAVLFVSGHSADLLNSQGLTESGGRLLVKPFTASQLSAALRQTIDEARRRPAAGAEAQGGGGPGEPIGPGPAQGSDASIG